MKISRMFFVGVGCFLPMLAAADTFCVTNTDSVTWYYSVRAQDGSGNSNFVLKPGERHKMSFNEPARYYVCYGKAPMTTDCPMRAKLIDLLRC